MSTKLSYWLRNKDKSSKKSAGCMTGIFQLFDRQFLLSSRKLNGQYHEKSPSADETMSLCKQGADYRNFCNLEQNLSRSYQENSRSSMESSTRTSFSSPSTSCSSPKHRLPKQKPKSSEQSLSSVKSLKNSTKARSADINQSPGYRESIKESIYKDLKNVSIKEKTKGEVKRNKVLKPVDSPRPLDQSKMKELEESLETLIKLRDLPMNFHEVSGSPRFSFDGRISSDIKQVNIQKEHRRLSLDSMKDSVRLDFISRVNSLMKELEKKNNSRIYEASNLHQDLKRNENQTNIIAKLMGLRPIDSARESYDNGHEPVNNQKKQEHNHGSRLVQSATNSPKSRSSINRHMKSNSISRLAVEEAQQKMAVEDVEGNMKKKIEPVYNAVEKTLQKLEFHQNRKEIRDLKRAVLETKNSAKVLSPTRKPEKSIISERALKSAGIASSQCAKLEGPSGLTKIKTSDLRDRKKESFSADGGQTPTGKTAKSLNSPAKGKGRGEGDNSVSPRLKKRVNPDIERKSSTVIPSYGLKKNQNQPDSREQSESLSPSSRIRQKSRQEQLNEGKSHLFHQTKGKTAINAASASKHKIFDNEDFVEELEKIAPQLSSPNSVLDSSPYHEDLPLSPLSDSSISNEEEIQPSDHSLKTTHLHQNLPSTLSFEQDARKQEKMDTEDHKFIFPGSTTDSNIDPDNKYVAEVLLSSSLLTADSHVPSILKQMKLAEPFEAVEKNHTQMLHKQLVYDVVNEILTRKTEPFNPCCSNMLSLQLLFKELCLEVKYLQGSIDRSFRDEDTLFTKDLLRRSNAWDRFDGEVPVVVLEIERLIFVDLISEIVGGLNDI